MTREPLSDAARLSAERERKWREVGDVSLGRRLAQIGVLGWLLVLPTLAGMFLGRWLDTRFGTEIFFTAPLLLVGLGLGCRFGWNWMHRS